MQARTRRREVPFLAVLALGIAALNLGGRPVHSQEGDAEAIAQARSLSRAFRRAAERTTPSVVTIISKHKITDDARALQLREMMRDPQLRRLFPQDREEQDPEERLPGEGVPGFETNIGAGVIMDADGIILTNNHVVAGADEVIVRLPGGMELTGKEIRTDPLSDLAVIRIETDTQLTAAPLGDSDALEIGDWVIAIGSPFELEATVSAGIISGKGRGISRVQRGSLLQTDAAINPGNSGGPLVSLTGEVIGINTAIATRNGFYQGVGFAIPINNARWVASELLEFGKVRRAYLGIRISELTAEAARRFELPARSGVWVQEVIPDAPAHEAGIKSNDVIVEFAGVPVRSPGDLQGAVERKPIGSMQKVSVMRKGERVMLDVKMTALPEELRR
ncbi:MAG: S1C family serine protease [Pirellulaceae bacterium]